MSDKKTSQSQQDAGNPAPSFPADPAAALSAGMDQWARMSEQGVKRMRAAFDELAAFEAKGYERARSAADELTKLASDSVAYMNQIASEWRRLTLDAARKGADMMSRS